MKDPLFPESIAEVRLIGVFPDGTTRAVTLRVGRPYAVDEFDFECPVSAEGLYDRLKPIRGVGSWHSLILGQRMLRELLQTEVKRGATFHWPNDEHAVTVEELFGLHEIT